MRNLFKRVIKKIFSFLAPTFWFFVGFIFASITLTSFILIYFNLTYKDKALPGIFIGNVYVGDMSQKQIRDMFNKKNDEVRKSSITYSYSNIEATASAKDLNIGFDANLLSTQAVSLGKSGDIFTDFYLIVNSYINGTSLPFAYTFQKDLVEPLLGPIQKQVYVAPVNAKFVMQNNKVTTFQQSSNGQAVDYNAVENMTEQEVPILASAQHPMAIHITVPVITLKPPVSTDQANDLGIVEGVGVGKSTYFGSDPNRIHNIVLAASKLNGIIVAPNEVFSFDKAIGDISQYSGYAQAYVIQNGRTVLGDGGGVCQVSTTLFRAILNAGLPVVERHGHAYRVGYYEQNSPPGFDATIYVPTVDLKFKNDTSHYILIQSNADPTNSALSFTLYGTSDGRVVNISTPVITNQTPPPPPLYQDDPSSPVGVVKQVDFAASGADVSFTRTVTRNNKVIISDTFNTNYQPWQAVYLRGTKTN